jgi:hypothetical protein
LLGQHLVLSPQAPGLFGRRLVFLRKHLVFLRKHLVFLGQHLVFLRQAPGLFRPAPGLSPQAAAYFFSTSSIMSSRIPLLDLKIQQIPVFDVHSLPHFFLFHRSRQSPQQSTVFFRIPFLVPASACAN